MASLALRADIRHNGRNVLGQLLELRETTAEITAEVSAFTGDLIDLRLSFPGADDILSLKAHVVAVHPPKFPSHPERLTIGFVFRDERNRKRLRELIAAPSMRAVRPDYHVLVVDGNALVREAFAHRLTRHGAGAIQVSVAARASAALLALDYDRFDLLVVDSALDDGDGASLIDRIRERDESVAIVGTSAEGESAHRAMVAAGADLFLHKPVSPRVLLDTYDRVLAIGSGRWPMTSQNES